MSKRVSPIPFASIAFDLSNFFFNLPYRFPFCRMACKSLKPHIALMHENKRIDPNLLRKFLCEVCGKYFISPSTLASHKITHLDKDLTQVQCEICEKWVKNPNVLRTHKKRHENGSLKCTHCGKLVYSATELRAHIAQFHEMRKYQCSICNKAFLRPMRLREHMATHTGTAIYKCLYCTKTFRGSSNRFSHLKRNHPNEWKLHHKRKSKKIEIQAV